MAPRIILIRHAEALHNILPEDHTIPDPPLSKLGETQASEFPTRYPHLFELLDPNTSIIACSPFTRTLQTALSSFRSVLPPYPFASCIPFILLPQLQECGLEPCDTGAPLAEKKARFERSGWIDWGEVEREEGWRDKEGDGFYSAKEEMQRKRGLWVRQWIKSRPEAVILIISHHGFLRRITKTPQGGSHWPNAEAREYAFKDPTGADPECDVERVVSHGAGSSEVDCTRDLRFTSRRHLPLATCHLPLATAVGSSVLLPPPISLYRLFCPLSITTITTTATAASCLYQYRCLRTALTSSSVESEISLH